MTSPFDALVEDYDAARPSYPAELFAALPRLVGLAGLAGVRVVEIGAGTGIATRELVRHGAQVLAVDVAGQMLRRLLVRVPGVAAVQGSAEALPVRDRAADLVCAAQAWHWVAVPAATREVCRVLRPGGALAIWWNDVAGEGLGWYEGQQERLEARSPGYRRDYRRRDFVGELAATGLFDQLCEARFSWERELDPATYERWLRSKSYVAALGAGLEAFLAAERRSMAAAFPDGRIREPFRTWLCVARVGRSPGIA